MLGKRSWGLGCSEHLPFPIITRWVHVCYPAPCRGQNNFYNVITNVIEDNIDKKVKKSWNEFLNESL